MLLFDRTPFRCRRCHRRFYSTRNRQEAEAAAAAGHEEPVDQRAG
jgi:tRNA(Ile2) C34 agmatinyltransferase TiaS